ncbi:MAG: hypothetical protein ABS81_26950 [Pseudonocardia sp. SCN 72-86]|nr:MAG: hypothetical protein ABS81_26950 [Pseudonocardia sp. SCN 72-86]
MTPYGNGPAQYGQQPGYGYPPPPPRPPMPGARSYGEAPGYPPPQGYAPPQAPSRAGDTRIAPSRSGGSGRSIATIVVVVLAVLVVGGGAAYWALGGSLPFGSGAAKPAAVSTTDTPAAGTADAGPADTEDTVFAGGAGSTAPACPFSAAQISSLVGQPMKDDGNCLFGDGKGVAQLSITMSSASTGEIMLDTLREQASGQYDEVSDLSGAKGYVATKELGGEAVAVTGKGGYTITMSSFERFSKTGYGPVLTKIADALPA